MVSQSTIAYCTVFPDVSVSPLLVKLDGADKLMSAGRLYEISCRVYGAHPSPVIKWLKGNEKMKNYPKSVRLWTVYNNIAIGE